MVESPIFRLRDIEPDILLSERDKALTLLQDTVPYAAVSEIGSTAIPGVIGKNDVDLLVKVSAEHFTAARQALDKQLQRNSEQFAAEDFQGYVIPSPLDISAQLIVSGGRHDTFERFVQLLSRDANLRQAYNSLKREWNGGPMDGYRLAKRAFIEAVLGSQKDRD